MTLGGVVFKKHAWQNGEVRTFCILCLTLALITTPLAQATPPSYPSIDRTSVLFSKKPRELTKAQAIQRARSKFGGEPLAAQRIAKPHTNPRYRIKLLSDGRVRIVWVDAYTGSVTSK